MTNVFKKCAFLMMFAGLSAFVSASDLDLNRYFYVGASAGISDYSDVFSCSDCDDLVNAFTHEDENGRATTLFGGYRFSKYFAAELGLFDLGLTDFSIVEDIGDSNFRRISRFTTNIRGISASAKGILPVGKRVDLFAKAGLHYYEFELGSSYVNPPDVLFEYTTFDWHGTNLRYGAGVDVRLSRRWLIGAAFDNYRADTDNFENTTLEEDDLENMENWTFDVRNLSVQVAFRF